MDFKTPTQTSSELHPGSIPLINISRTPSPYPRGGSNHNSENEDDDFGHSSSPRRPFLLENRQRNGWKGILLDGGLGRWLFSSAVGWQFYVGFLVLWLGGCGIGLILLNRIILLSMPFVFSQNSPLTLLPAGVYKFPYPVTATFFELCLTHVLLIAAANLTRLFSKYIAGAGLSGMIAPAYPLQKSSLNSMYRGSGKKSGILRLVLRLTMYGSGGIAGGGLFEFDLKTARQVFVMASVYVLKVILSNLSFAWTQLPVYLLARIAIVPFSLLFSRYINGTSHSIPLMSSALAATINLLIATTRGNIRMTWEGLLSGAFSSVFTALFPVLIERTYHRVLANISPESDLLTEQSIYSTGAADASGSKEEARATWQLLHYTSLISIMIVFPIIFFSGEFANISRNCYILDVFFHWLMVTCGGLGSWAVFFGTFVLTRATSPVTTSFVFTARAAFILPVLAKFNIPAHSWVGVIMCWGCCAWFMQVRRNEGRVLERLRSRR